MKYNGKEEQREEFGDGSGLEWMDYGARMYDGQVGRWHNLDPLAENRYWKTTFNYVQNNPLLRFDPDGRTDYTLNKKTGDIIQVGDENNEPDRILKSKVNRKGELKIKNKSNGKPKVAIDKIQKGILRSGMNLKDRSELISVGGEGQPTEEHVEEFVVKLGNHVGKEIGGMYLNTDGSNNTTHITIGAYNENEVDEVKNRGRDVVDFNIYNIKGFYHTHPVVHGNQNDLRFEPSFGDRQFRNDQLKVNPNLKFILTAVVGVCLT